MASTGEPPTEPEPRRRWRFLPRIPPVERAPCPERRVRGEDLQAAPRQDEEQRNVQPVRQTNQEGLWALSLPPAIGIDCFHAHVTPRSSRPRGVEGARLPARRDAGRRQDP